MDSVSVVREVAPSARVAGEAVIGPYCVIGPGVTIGPGTVLASRVCVTGDTIIGSDNVVAEGCVLGATPQDLKYAGGATMLIIGHRNRFAAEVTVHIGTEAGGSLTRIGDDNVFMEACHVAHDCYVDDRAFLDARVQLAGHIHVQTGAVMEVMSAAHHFATIGRYARVQARTPVRRDVPPFTLFGGAELESRPQSVRGIHEQGIRAAGLAPHAEKELRRVLADLFDDETALQTKIEQQVAMGVEGEVAALCEFVQRSLRGVYGRHREMYRGKIPPEAEKYLPHERQALLRRMMS